MSHPEASPERVIALTAAVVGDTTGYGRVEIDLAGNRDAYARVVDTLDALAWLTADCVHRYQRSIHSQAWERITVGGVEISGPLGFTPASDRFGLTPLARLSDRTLQAVRDEADTMGVDFKKGTLVVFPQGGGDAA